MPPISAATYHVFVTSHNLLVPFSSSETPGLPLSHRDRRTKLPLLWLSLLTSWYCLLWGDPAALPYLLLRHFPGKECYCLKSPLKGTGQRLRPHISQVSPATINMFSTSAAAFPTLDPGKKILPSEQREVLWSLGSGPSLPTSPADLLWVAHCAVTPSFCRDIEAYSKQREWRHQITLCRITEMPQEEAVEFSSLIG